MKTLDLRTQEFQKTTTPRRASAVSQVLKAIRDDVEEGTASWDLTGPGMDEALAGTRLLVATDRFTRQRAYALAQRVYQACGYLRIEEQNLGAVAAYDAHPETVTLLIEDVSGEDIATVSLVFDSPGGLPCDEIYLEELNGLRAEKRRLVEVTRLAISETHKNNKALLVRLFNAVFTFALRVRAYHDLVIEVNPRHVRYYSSLLGFEILGTERACPRVQNAPAVLLRLDLSKGEREVPRLAGNPLAASERTLCKFFYTEIQESALAEFLAQQQKPMSKDEMRFFGLEGAACMPTEQLTGVADCAGR